MNLIGFASLISGTFLILLGSGLTYFIIDNYYRHAELDVNLLFFGPPMITLGLIATILGIILVAMSNKK